VCSLNPNNSPKPPPGDVRLAATIAAINLIVKTQDTIIIRQVKGGASVQVLNEEVHMLCGGIRETGVLGLPGLEHALEIIWLAGIAFASFLGVQAGESSILPERSAAVTLGRNAVDAGAQERKEADESGGVGLHVDFLKCRGF
jgi:hypothetical protein